MNDTQLYLYASEQEFRHLCKKLGMTDRQADLRAFQLTQELAKTSAEYQKLWDVAHDHR